MSWKIRLFAITLCVGCAESQADHTTVRDSAGVQIVENGAGAWSEAERLHVSSEPLVRIGAVFGSDLASQFTSIDAVRRLSDGRIVVLEDQTAELRWFDAGGRHLYTSGGRGGGPGEFEATLDVLVLPGDTLLVLGGPRVKFVRFAPDGSYVDEDPLDYDRYGDLARWIECPRLMLPDRSLISCIRSDSVRTVRERPGHFREFQRFALATPSLDTIFPLGRHGGIEQWVVDTGGRFTYVFHPFYSYGFVAAGGDPTRIAIAENPEYRIEVWSPAGELERIITRRNARRAPTAAEQERALERLRSRAGGDEALNRILAEIEVPELLPAVRDLWISSDGHIWVSRVPFSREGAWIWDVFDSRGIFLGEVTVPNGFVVYEPGPDYLLGISRDGDDVPFVELYALERRNGG